MTNLEYRATNLNYVMKTSVGIISLDARMRWIILSMIIEIPPLNARWASLIHIVAIH
jgi:hypothetical protein